MMRRRPILAALACFTCLAVATGGCASTQSGGGDGNSEENESRPVEQASFDLGCPESELDWVKLGEAHFGVEGCGLRARYMARCNVCGAEVHYQCHCKYEVQEVVRIRNSEEDAESPTPEEKSPTDPEN